MLKTLLKKQMMEIFRSYFYDSKKNRKRPRITTMVYICLYAVLMLGVLGGIFSFLAFTICGPLVSVGMNWLYFTLMGLISILLGAFGSVFNTYSSLYLAKDNDLLLSMPIPVRHIMTAPCTRAPCWIPPARTTNCRRIQCGSTACRSQENCACRPDR